MDSSVTGAAHRSPRLALVPGSTPEDVVSSTRQAAEALQHLDPAASWPSLAQARDLPNVVQALAENVHAVQAACARLGVHLADVEDEYDGRQAGGAGGPGDRSEGNRRGDREEDPALLAAVAELQDAAREAGRLVTTLNEACAAVVVALRPPG